MEAATSPPRGEPTTPITALEIPAEFVARFRRLVLGVIAADADLLETMILPGANQQGSLDPDDCREALRKIDRVAAVVEQIGWVPADHEKKSTVSAPVHVLTYTVREIARVTSEIAAGEGERLGFAQWLTEQMGRFGVGVEAR